MALQPSAKCSIIRSTKPVLVVGQLTNITFTLKNTGNAYGPIRVEPVGLTHSHTPNWVEGYPGVQGDIVLTINEWPGGKIQIQAQHWNYDTQLWVTDSTVSWPGDVFNIKTAAIVGAIALGAVVLAKRRR